MPTRYGWTRARFAVSKNPDVGAAHAFGLKLGIAPEDDVARLVAHEQRLPEARVRGIGA